MSDCLIRILDDATVDKIAAGEVVERPASVVKELVENSLDAGAKNIVVEVSDGGRQIRVIDDGQGMSATDAQLAIKRHATSKIATVEDLLSLFSMGFRGEALPSIAAVSRFTLLTRRREDEYGYRLEVDFGRVKGGQPTGLAVGTVVEVDDLFGNVPARKKFLRTDRTEIANISETVCKLALANSEVGFRLSNNGRLLLATAGDGDLLALMADIYGLDDPGQLLAVGLYEEGLAIDGWVGKPALLKSTRRWQTLAVNRRVVQSRVVSKAIDNAYHSLLPRSGYPLSVLRITVEPSAVDVNVHPQKCEVKFADEQKVYRAVYRALIDKIARPGTMNRDPVYRSVVGGRIEVDGCDQRLIEAIVDSFVPGETGPASGRPQDGDTGLFAEPSAAYGEAFGLEQNDCRVVGAAFDSYIIATKGEELLIIDQHAAHERIYYDRLYYESSDPPCQMLVWPRLVRLMPGHCQILERHNNELSRLGWRLTVRGRDTVSLEGIPADLSPDEAEMLLKELAEQHGFGDRRDGAGEIRHRLAQKLACCYAVKAGQSLTGAARQKLLENLFATRLPYTCPHGRPIIISYSRRELAKMFKRQ
ncbi:MAG: DNA mismatch repair endonuclease MutL [Negativicutes bacterium]|nr:DNA mismatch repair endonuclease MutL [Negativicutes bacterium]